ncbi:UNVERIFIED_CONTAM: hypothetical protein FKN15_053025 [Acipenser sinensis]
MPEKEELTFPEASKAIFSSQGGRSHLQCHGRRSCLPKDQRRRVCLPKDQRRRVCLSKGKRRRGCLPKRQKREELPAQEPEGEELPSCVRKGGAAVLCAKGGGATVLSAVIASATAGVPSAAEHHCWSAQHCCCQRYYQCPVPLLVLGPPQQKEKNEQMDLIVRYWDNDTDQVAVRYLGRIPWSCHAADLMEHFKQGKKLSDLERVTSLKVYNWFANRRKEIKRKANIEAAILESHGIDVQSPEGHSNSDDIDGNDYSEQDDSTSHSDHQDPISLAVEMAAVNHTILALARQGGAGEIKTEVLDDDD